MSYLHVSWELPDDLTDESICVLAATHSSSRNSPQKKVKQLISEVDKRIEMGLKLYPDLTKDEYFPREFLHVECVLGLEDTEKVRKPTQVPKGGKGTIDDKDVPTSISLSSHHDERNPDPNYSVIATEKSRDGLHGVDAALIIKWKGLPESHTTTEHIADLQASCVDYEVALRHYLYSHSSSPTCSPDFFVDFTNPSVYSTYTRARTRRSTETVTGRWNDFSMSIVPPIMCEDIKDGTVVNFCDLSNWGYSITRAYLEDPRRRLCEAREDC